MGLFAVAIGRGLSDYLAGPLNSLHRAEVGGRSKGHPSFPSPACHTITNVRPRDRKETCSSGKLYKMCPLCDEDIGCRYWHLSDICAYSRLSYLFDHPGTLFYAIFVSFWGLRCVHCIRLLL